MDFIPTTVQTNILKRMIVIRWQVKVSQTVQMSSTSGGGTLTYGTKGDISPQQKNHTIGWQNKHEFGVIFEDVYPHPPKYIQGNICRKYKLG